MLGLAVLATLMAGLPGILKAVLVLIGLAAGGFSCARLLRPRETSLCLQAASLRLRQRNGRELVVGSLSHCFVSSRYIGLVGRNAAGGGRLRRGWFRSSLGDEGFRQLAVALRAWPTA